LLQTMTRFPLSVGEVIDGQSAAMPDGVRSR